MAGPAGRLGYDPSEAPVQKTWRILTDGDKETEPLTADQIAERLWAAEPSLWAIPPDGGAGAFPENVEDVRESLLADPVRVADAFLRQNPDWVFLWVMEMAEHHAHRLFPVVRQLVQRARDDKDLAFVAAGPLEDLLRLNGPAVISLVEDAASNDARFRRALSGVWRSEIADDVWGRIQAARRGEPGLDD